MNSQADVKIESGGNLDVKSGGQVNIEGSMVNLN